MPTKKKFDVRKYLLSLIEDPNADDVSKLDKKIGKKIPAGLYDIYMRTVLVLRIRQLDKAYQNEFKSERGSITRDYFREHGVISEKELLENFKSFSELKELAFPKEPEEPVFNRDSITVTRSEEFSDRRRKYFVTSAVAGQSANSDFFASVRTYCQKNKAELVILPMRGISKRDASYDPSLQANAQDHFVSEFVINTNLVAFDKLIYPQQMNPLTGFARLGQKDKSIIVASPKQFMEAIPVSPNSYPHTLHSTGAITNPENYAHTRAGALAFQDHVIGGLIVEVKNSKVFHIRQVQADKKGGFYNLNEYYQGKNVSQAKARAFILGDYHAGFHDDVVINNWLEVTDLCKPEYVLAHDLVDAISISHHSLHNMYEQVNCPEHMNTLEKELDVVAKELKRWNKKAKFVVVRSNHDEHIDRYLHEGREKFDRFNYKCAHKLAGYYIGERLNPLQKYMEEVYGIKDVRWLKRDEDFILEGVQLGYHGDRGPGGARGTPQNIERAFGKSVTGHRHYPVITRQTWGVGTSTYLQRNYTAGSPSSWLNTSCLLYPGGARSLVTSINGEWRA